MNNSVKLYGKRFILLCLLGLLLLPASQAWFKYTDIGGELDGYFEGPAPYPDLDWEALWDNSYQPALERYVDEHIGFRTFFIKLRNQLSYSLLHETDNPNLFIGRNDALFDSRTLYGYVGMDAAVDSAAVQRHIRHLRVVQDTLARRGKLLVFVAAASKASFMPENMPPYFRRITGRKSNYEKYTAAMRAAGINLLDLSRVVRSWKDTATYPLFPRYGGHWSNYAAVLAGDTLMRYVQQQYGHKLRDYHMVAGEVSAVPRDNDNDTEKPLNLLLPLPAYNMWYPQVQYDTLKPGQRRPTALIMGDSFVFTILYTFLAQSFDDKLSRFWLRNVVNETVIWPGDAPEGKDIKALDHKAQYLARDIILIMFTEYNLDQRLDYGFSDDAYKLFVPYTHTDSLNIRKLEHQLTQRPGMADYWWKKSAETGSNQDQLVHQAAIARYDSIR